MSAQGLLVMNHEYINQTFLHPKGPTKVDGRRPEDEVIRETNAHGVSVIHIKRSNHSKVEIVKNSIFNRRITASTVMGLQVLQRVQACLQLASHLLDVKHVALIITAVTVIHLGALI